MEGSAVSGGADNAFFSYFQHQPADSYLLGTSSALPWCSIGKLGRGEHRDTRCAALAQHLTSDGEGKLNLIWGLQ